MGRESLLRRELASALRHRVPLRQIHEAFLQLYLFAGFPRMINAFMALEGMSKGSPAVEPALGSRAQRARGEKLCRAIYGRHYEPMIARMESMHPDLARWILTEGYGKVLSRPRLPARVRELLVIGILTAQGLDKQLYFHVKGAVRLGATPADVRRALEACRDLIPRRRIARCLAMLGS